MVWVGRTCFFMSEKLPNYCLEAVRRLRQLLGLSTAVVQVANVIYDHMIEKFGFQVRGNMLQTGVVSSRIKHPTAWASFEPAQLDGQTRNSVRFPAAGKRGGAQG